AVGQAGERAAVEVGRAFEQLGGRGGAAQPGRRQLDVEGEALAGVEVFGVRLLGRVEGEGPGATGAGAAAVGLGEAAAADEADVGVGVGVPRHVGERGIVR